MATPKTKATAQKKMKAGAAAVLPAARKTVKAKSRTAKAGAERHSNRWRKLVAVPLFAGIPSSEEDT